MLENTEDSSKGIMEKLINQKPTKQDGVGYVYLLILRDYLSEDGRYFVHQIEIAKAAVRHYHEAPLWNAFDCRGIPMWDHPENITASPFFSLDTFPHSTPRVWCDRGMTHDPEVYHDPMAFKPERFLSHSDAGNGDGMREGREPEPDPRGIVFGFGRRCVICHFPIPERPSAY